MSGARISVSAAVPGGTAVQVAGTVTAADGTFAVRGVARGEAITFLAQAAGAWETRWPAHVVAGATDVRLVAARVTGVSGSVELPDGLEPEDVEVVLTAARDLPRGLRVGGSPTWTQQGRELRFRCEARPFRVEGLAPGTYDFGVRFCASERFLVQRTGVHLTGDLIELEPLVVPGTVHRVPVLVRTADDAPLPGARLWARESGDAGGYREVALGADGVASVATFGDEVALAASATGTDFVFGSAQAAGVTLTPRSSAGVDLRLAPSAGHARNTLAQDALAKAGAKLRIRWIAPAEAPSPTRSDDVAPRDPRASVEITCALPATGAATLRVIVPGWYQVGVRTEDAHGSTEHFIAAVRVDGTATVTAPIDVSDVEPPRRAPDVASARHGTGLRGTVVLPEGLDFADLVLVISGPSRGLDRAALTGRGRRSTQDWSEFDAEPAFSATGVLPGNYEVRLKFRGSSRWLARVKDVEVKAGEVAVLEPLLVTEPIRRTVVRVVLPAGVPAGSVKLWARNGGDRGDFREIEAAEDGASAVSFVGADVTLAAHAAGTAFVFATTALGEATLTLTPSAPRRITVRLPEGLSARARTGGAFVQIAWCAAPETPAALAREEAEKDPRTTVETDVRLPADGPVTASLDTPGWYRVSFGVQSIGGSRWRQGDIVLIDGTADVTADLAMTAHEIEEFLDDR